MLVAFTVLVFVLIFAVDIIRVIRRARSAEISKDSWRCLVMHLAVAVVAYTVVIAVSTICVNKNEISEQTHLLITGCMIAILINHTGSTMLLLDSMIEQRHQAGG